MTRPRQEPLRPDRRRLLLGALASALSAPAVALAAGRDAGIAVPVVDRLALHMVVDAQVSAFAEPVERADLVVERAAPRSAAAGPPRDTLVAEFGFSMLAESWRDGASRRILIDAGYTARTLANNLGLLGLDPSTFDAVVLSHGHYDHFGGLPALLAGPRALRRGTRVHVGGEEIFCARDSLVRGVASPFGRVDREALLAAGLDIESGIEPRVIAGHAFTTGRIPLVTSERAVAPTLMRPGIGCEPALLDADKRELKVVPDDLRHELATAWLVRGRGLVIASSCSHRGLVNAIRQAQEVSGVSKVHAVVGGFHLVWPRTDAEAMATVAALEQVAPDYVVPMHCTGEAFIAEAQRRLPGRVIRPYVGSRFAFAAT